MNSKLLALTVAVVSLLSISWSAQELKIPKGPKVGAQAPSFRLNDMNGVAVSVGGKSEGWTVLAFYPKALTPG